MSEHDTRHILSQSKANLADVVSLATGLPTKRVIELLKLGSIYVDSKRCIDDCLIEEGTYVRAHIKPKRYPVADIDWHSRIELEDEHMWIVNKPKGVPVHPMLDNISENVVTQMAKAFQQDVFVTQRLDVGTEGLFVLAKTKAFQRAFNEALKNKQVFKKYRARAEAPLPHGEYVHFMLNSLTSPKIVRDVVPPDTNDSWQVCALRVIGNIPCPPFVDIEIELITGRTHQIRAQLSKLDRPLCGDLLYGGKGDPSQFKLVSTQLRFKHPLEGNEIDCQLS